MRVVKFGPLFLAAALSLLAVSASAGDLSDWNVAPLKLDLDGWTATLGGDANLTAYTARQSAGAGREGATASLFVDPRIEKLFDNGWNVGLRTTLNLYHDALSGDNYGNHFFQKAYAFVQTPYGRVELGQQDGASYKMAVSGPLVAEAVALDDANIIFFRDPTTNDALTKMFAVRTAVFATYNAAKISYYSPRLFGVQLGASYTPHLAKDVLPFLTPGPHAADRQDNLFEGAINYTGFFGRTSLGAYAGFAAGHNAQRTAAHADLLDWAMGGEVDYDLGDATLAVGGAWHQSNGYTFEPGGAFHHGTTHAAHASTKLTTGPWLLGLEYSTGTADAEALMPKLDITGYEAAIGYVINSNLQLTAGWQHQRFSRSTGVFYNAQPHVGMDAGFLYLQFHV